MEKSRDIIYARKKRKTKNQKKEINKNPKITKELSQISRRTGIINVQQINRLNVSNKKKGGNKLFALSLYHHYASLYI